VKNQPSQKTSNLNFNEKDLIEQAVSGNKDAAGTLYELHVLNVRRLLLSVLGPHDYIDDLTQDIFISAFASLKNFKHQSLFSTWLHRITVNKAVSFLRRNKKYFSFTTLDNENALPFNAPTQENEIDVNRQLIALFNVLQNLSPKRRVVFTLFEIEGFTLKEIAEITGTTIPVIKSRLFFARKSVEKLTRNNPLLQPLLKTEKSQRIQGAANVQTTF
jgi:RNA polymerase sigma-70 factor (ECF subfamily)